MAKLRKMLGDINAPIIGSLKGLIETQSKETLANWAIRYAEEHFLDIYEKSYPEDMTFHEAIKAVREYVAGEMKLKDVKPFLREAAKVAREVDGNPAAQAAARAVSVACAVIQTPTNALGFTFYGAAAVAYDRLGLEEKREVYDAVADGEFQNMLKALEAVAVENEENPAKINWNC